MFEVVEKSFARIAPAVDFCSLRFVEERHERLQVRQDVVEPVGSSSDVGAMVTVVHQGGAGYAATSEQKRSRKIRSRSTIKN